MKKALVLGVMALFAINIATVQNVNAQDRTATPKKVDAYQVDKKANKEKPVPVPSVSADKNVKAEKQEADKKCCDDKDKKACKQADAKSIKAKEAEAKTAAAKPEVKKNDTKTEIKKAGANKKVDPKTSTTKIEEGKKPATVEKDPTAKNKTPEIGVPPTPGKEKKESAKSASTSTNIK